MEIYTDPSTGRPYVVDPRTGRSRWFDLPASPAVARTQELPVVPDGRGGSRARPDGVSVIVKLLGALVIVSVFGTALTLVVSRSRAEPTRPPAAAPTPTRTTPPRPPALGTPVRDGKFEFIVHGTRTTKTLGNAVLHTTAHGAFVLVSVRVRNISDEHQNFLSLAQKLHDEKGNEYGTDVRATLYLGHLRNLYDDVGPGRTVDGTLVFDLPAGARPARIELHDSLLSGGTDVMLT
ncbi:MAG TPA: DUF4352 domain-containing protein [Kineosporiaceae bacterium]